MRKGLQEPESAHEQLPVLSESQLERGTLYLSEAAARLGISVKAARRAVLAGEIAAIRIGRRWLILRGPFEDMLQSRSDGRARPM